jgi:hypothetical protein
MAAPPDRPFYVTGGAEGTALGVAALGLPALGSRGQLADAVSLLMFPEIPASSPAEPDPDLVATNVGSRASPAGLIGQRDAVSALCAGRARHG